MIRLLNILLHMRYPTNWNISKSKLLIKITWIISIMLCSSVSVAYYFYKFRWENIFFIYVYPAIDAAFIILAIITYTLLFKKYRGSYLLRTRAIELSSKSTSGEDITAKPQSGFKLFNKSRFYIPVVLILVFLLFVALPDLIFLIIGIHALHESQDIIFASCWILYAICNAVDAVVYVFLQQRVRNLLKEKVKKVINVRLTCRKPLISH